jgi:hypothetical protein
MVSKASSKPADSTANLGFEAKLWLTADSALRDSAFLQSEASPQVVSEAKDNFRIYEPACGSGGSLPASRLCGVRFAVQDRAIAPGGVQSQGQDKWARRQRPFGLAKRARRVRLRRQQPKQSNATTRRLAIMNLAIRGIEADFGPEHADTFRRDLHPDLRADYVLANPPFNDSDWFRKDDYVPWQWSGGTWTTDGCPQGERGGVHQFGVPPKGSANFPGPDIGRGSSTTSRRRAQHII